jgi:hypothetical protein
MKNFRIERIEFFSDEMKREEGLIDELRSVDD